MPRTRPALLDWKSHLEYMRHRTKVNAVKSNHVFFRMDLFSRQIVGWAMDKHMKNKLTHDALAMAYWRRKPLKGLLHHSDRGSQYACYEYQAQLQH
jgi:transposase InsO family protein